MKLYVIFLATFFLSITIVSADVFGFGVNEDNNGGTSFIVINDSLTNVNNSQFLLGFTWANAPYPASLSSTFNSTYDSFTGINNASIWTAINAGGGGGSNSSFNTTYNAFTFANNDSIWAAIAAGGGNGTVNQSFVPYVGASSNVNLNNFNLTNVQRIGIGTATPVQSLDVAGNIRVTNELYVADATTIAAGYVRFIFNGIVDFSNIGTNGGMRFTGGTSPSSSISFLSTSGAGTTDFMDFRTGNNGQNVMRIISNGNMGIQTFTPQTTLDVNGTARISNNATLNGRVFMNNLTFNAGGNALCIDVTTNETYNSGDISCISSSIKYKTNVSNVSDLHLQEMLSNISATPLFYWNFNSTFGFNSKEQHIGLMAENLPPEVVRIDALGNPNIDTVTALMGYTWGGIKALDIKVKAITGNITLNLSTGFVPFNSSTRNIDLNGKEFYNVSRIGIGTSNPLSQLEVYSGNGIFKFDKGEFWNHPHLTIINNLTGSKAISLIAGNVGSGISFDRSGFFAILPENKAIFYNNSEGQGDYYFRISSDGKTGIGLNNAPSNTLDVRGDGNFSGTVYINNNTDIRNFIPYNSANKDIDFNDHSISNINRITSSNGSGELIIDAPNQLNINSVLTLFSGDTNQFGSYVSVVDSTSAMSIYDTGIQRTFNVDTITDRVIVDGKLRLSPSAQGTCNVFTQGDLYYNVTTHKHYGCNSTSWNELY